MQTDPTERPIDTLTVAALAVCLATPETGAPFAALREALTENGREPTEWPALIEAVRDHAGNTTRFAEAVEAWVGPFAWLEPKVRAVAEAALAYCLTTPAPVPPQVTPALRSALIAIGATDNTIFSLLRCVSPHVTDLGAFGLAVERWAVPEPGAPGWYLIDGNGYGPDRYSEQA